MPKATTHKLETFGKFLLSKGYSPGTAHNYLVAIRRALRAGDVLGDVNVLTLYAASLTIPQAAMLRSAWSVFKTFAASIGKNLPALVGHEHVGAKPERAPIVAKLVKLLTSKEIEVLARTRWEQFAVDPLTYFATIDGVVFVGQPKSTSIKALWEDAEPAAGDFILLREEAEGELKRRAEKRGAGSAESGTPAVRVVLAPPSESADKNVAEAFDAASVLND